MSIKKVLSFLAISAEVMALSACMSDDAATIIGGPDAQSASPSSAVVHDRSFIWSVEKGLQLIPQPSYAEDLTATAINNHGQVAGYLTLHDGSDDDRAFMWSPDDGLERLGSLVGAEGTSIALALSDDGEVHGLSEGPSTQAGPTGTFLGDAFVWTRATGMKSTTWKRFGDLKPVSEGGNLKMPPGAECMQVTGASPSGLAVGFAGLIEPLVCHPMMTILWELDGTPTVIDQCDTRRGCNTAGVHGINNRGDVIGYRGSNGFRWTRSGGFLEMPIQNGSLTAINENGDASGLVVIDYFVFKPLVWMASGEIKTIELPAGATSGYAVDINENGQVIGTFR